MPSRAVFINRTAAELAAQEAARAIGIPERDVMFRCVSFPVYERGALKGYEGWYPVSPEHRKPVMEA